MKDLETVIHLMSLSPTHHKHWVSDLERVVFPPLKSSQYRIFQSEKVPAAYASWAFLSPEAEDRISSFQWSRTFMPEDWDSGYEPWVMDVICPYGGLGAVKEVWEKLKELVLRHNKGEVQPGFEHMSGQMIEQYSYRRLSPKRENNFIKKAEVHNSLGQVRRLAA